MSVGNAILLRLMIQLDADCKLAADVHDFYLTTDLATWRAKTALVGTGHCVPLVQQATGAPTTSFWVKGPKVKGIAVPTGTAIATFNSQGQYANKDTGNHAAIYVSQDKNGITVLDQWVSKKPARPSERVIRFKGGVGSASNDGDQFSVVLTAKIANLPAKAKPGGR